MPIRSFNVRPRDVPDTYAARRLGLTLSEFVQLRDELFSRGFPLPDPTTGHYDLSAIDAWCSARNPHLFVSGGEAGSLTLPDDRVQRRLKEMERG